MMWLVLERNEDTSGFNEIKRVKWRQIDNDDPTKPQWNGDEQIVGLDVVADAVNRGERVQLLFNVGGKNVLGPAFEPTRNKTTGRFDVGLPQSDSPSKTSCFQLPMFKG